MKDIGISNYILIIFFFIALIVVILKSMLHLIFTIDIKNKDLCIKVYIKYMFNLINIEKQLYPSTNKKNRRKAKDKNLVEKSKIKTKLFFSNLLSILRLLDKIKIHEVYSKVNYGSEVFTFTSFIYILINTIYGNIANIVHTDKLYLVVNPDYTKNFIRASIRVHAVPKVKDLIKVGIAFIKIYNKNKEATKHESDKFNTKSYGNNS